jgi:hypothetical protein
MKLVETIATVLAFVVLAVGVVLFFGATLTVIFQVAGWHLPWSVIPP